MRNDSLHKYSLNTKKLSVIGLGKLGLCTGVCLADSGYSVLGIDNDPDVIKQISAGRAPHDETGLQDLLNKVEKPFTVALADYRAAITETDITFLIVPTPSTDGGNFSTRYLMESLKPMAEELAQNPKPYHLFVIVSTVSPGTLMEEIIPMVEFHSCRQINEGFGICYNPEFIALGSVIHDFFHPDLVLIGENGPSDGEILENIYHKVCRNRPKIARMSIQSAEITKISLNAFVTMKISFINTLTSLCDGIPGTDIDEITAALGADRRIGDQFLRGGAPFGGPCFPRDNRAFSEFACQHGFNAYLAEATDQINRAHTSVIIEKIDRSIGYGHKKIGVLGCAYKPGTPVLDKSFSVELIHRLLKKESEIMVFDAKATGNLRNVFENSIAYADSLEKCVTESDVLIIALPDPAYLSAALYLRKSTGKVIIDLWRILKDEELTGHFYQGFGMPR